MKEEQNIEWKESWRDEYPTNIFFRAGYIESWGRGIEKIFRECAGYGVPPPGFDFDVNGLMLTILANPTRVKERVGDRVGENLSENQKRILELLRQNPTLVVSKLAETIEISKRKTEANIAKLKDLGFLARIGPAKGGYWEILK